MSTPDFKNKVNNLVINIPEGHVMTYGQIAILCGKPGAARVVGQIAHFGDQNIPWHRIVNAKGSMASGFWPNGREGQAEMLKNEGIKVKDNIINLSDYLWNPKE